MSRSARTVVPFLVGACVAVLALAPSVLADRRADSGSSPPVPLRSLSGVGPIRAPEPVPTRWKLRPIHRAPQMAFDPDAPVVDVARAANDDPRTSGDIDPNIDVQITQEIIDKAVELGTAEAIYDFVRNEFRFQAYYGSRKGSVETLRQRAGNDYDLASLTIALLRALGIPSRYAEGEVEMPVDRATGWLGVDAGDVAGSILFTNGMEGISIVSGPDVVAVRARRIWVEAFVPRGFGSPTWVPLDPAFKQMKVIPGIDIPQAMGLDALAFVQDYYDPATSTPLPRPETVIGKLESDIEAYLTANLPGTTLDDARRMTDIAPERLGVLPSSLPYAVRSRDGSFDEIPAVRRYQVRFHLRNGGTTLIDHTFDLPTIASKRVTIDYVGATPGDQSIIDANGGIYQTPPSQVDLTPVLRLDGVDVATGTTGVGMGLIHESDLYFLAPTNGAGLPQNVVPAIFNTITCGASQAIGLSIDGVSDSLVNPVPADDTEGLASLRHDTALDYLGNVRRGDLSLASLMHSYVTTDVANAILENVVRVTYDGFGVPQTFDWVGLRVDADRSVLGVWPVDRLDPPGAEPKEFLVIAGAEGSLFESLTYEQNYGQDSVSTIKILQLASDAGVTIYHRWNTLPLPANTHSSADRTAIQNAILGGNEVTFPADPMTFGSPTTGQWTGTGWIDMSPADGAAGYIISGNNNGGATVESWPPEFIDLSEDDKDIRDVQIEIVTPDADSPDADAIFTRDNEETLTFEYRVHVTYDDGTMKTLPGGTGTYTRTTRNTTRTFRPGNYDFNVWIARRVWWIFNVTVARAERKVSIVGVQLRGPDGLFSFFTCGSDPPEFVPALPPAAGFPGLELQACIYPEQAPDGSDLAQGFTWSGGSQLAFSSTTTQTTMLQATGPSAALEDQDVDLVVDLPGGKQAMGVKTFNFAGGAPDEKLKVTAFRVEIEHPDPPPINQPANAAHIGNEFTFTASDDITVRCQAKVEPLINEVKDHVDDELKWTIPDITTFIGFGGWSWSDSWGFFSGAGKGHGIDSPLEAMESGLPSSNDDFGPRDVKLELRVDGTLYEADKHTIEIFYPRDEDNHPGAAQSSPGSSRSPNWFFYWNQTGAGRGDSLYHDSGTCFGAGGVYGLVPAMLCWNNPLAYDKDELWITDLSRTSDTRRDGSGQLVTGIDLFANVVAHEGQHNVQIDDNDAALGGLNGAGGTIWASGWSFNAAPDNHWSLGADGQPGMAGVDDDGDGTTDERNDRSEVGFPGSDDVDLDANGDSVADSLPYNGLGGLCGGSIENNACAQETIPQDTFWRQDWGDPGKQHATDRNPND